MARTKSSVDRSRIILDENEDQLYVGGDEHNNYFYTGQGFDCVFAFDGFDVGFVDGSIDDYRFFRDGVADEIYWENGTPIPGYRLSDNDFNSPDAADNLFYSVERIAFDDATIAVDERAASAYRLYLAAFDREPDQGGLSYWVDRMDHGLTLQAVSKEFLFSDEFKSLYGKAVSDEAYVALLYENVLDRKPDKSGLQYWIDEMEDGRSRADVLSRFSDSPENRANVADEIQNGITLDYGIFL